MSKLLSIRSPQRSPIATASVALTLLVSGCSCGPTMASIDGRPTDAGPFFGGIDAPGYEPTDSGPRPPEPCAVPVRRVRFPVGDGSLGHTNSLWASGSRAWVYLGGYSGPGSPPPSLHLFDLEGERELDIDFVLGEDDLVLRVFEAPTGFELLVLRSGGDGPHLVFTDRDGRLTGASEEELAGGPHVRLDDGRYVGMPEVGAVTSPVAAALEIAAPGARVERIDLGFETMNGHWAALHWTGETLVGVGYEDETASVLRFEVDLETAEVRLATLVEGVRPSGLLGRVIALWSSADTATVALTYEPGDAPAGSPQIAELFWWPIGGDTVTRHTVRPAADLSVGVLALGGAMPRQTLVLAQTSSSRTWVTAARVRAPGDVVGGTEPIGVFTGITDAAAWEPSAGTAALALLAQRELEVLYVCEGAP
ncbi:MAG: hypothetical protein M5U28_23030 [Sandaracinaceae bacterium]|nr:hypothetical protein [Sandaracinaceae bacterium]